MRLEPLSCVSCPRRTGKVLLLQAGSIGWDVDLTRPKWQKNRKKMASKMGKKSGRVR
jgi:hypothetical protein